MTYDKIEGIKAQQRQSIARSAHWQTRALVIAMKGDFDEAEKCLKISENHLLIAEECSDKIKSITHTAATSNERQQVTG